MKWPADEMTSTFIRALGHERWTGTFGSRIATALAAVLAAAPAVEGWVWCEHRMDVHGSTRTCTKGHTHRASMYGCEPCGPHRTLLLGPDVE